LENPVKIDLDLSIVFWENKNALSRCGGQIKYYIHSLSKGELKNNENIFSLVPSLKLKFSAKIVKFIFQKRGRAFFFVHLKYPLWWLLDNMRISFAYQIILYDIVSYLSSSFMKSWCLSVSCIYKKAKRKQLVMRILHPTSRSRINSKQNVIWLCFILYVTPKFSFHGGLKMWFPWYSRTKGH